MKKLLITGAAGFIGCNLVRYILGAREDVRILSYDLLTYAGSLQNLQDVMGNSRHEFVQGDIADAKILPVTIEKFEPDAIIHLAAETHVDRSIAAAQPFIHTNIVGQTNLLMAAQAYGAERKDFRFIHISTDEVFGALDAAGPPFDEQTRYDPHSPYSASKAAADHLTRAWHHTYGLPAIILNCSNNYGPYQLSEKLIPLMITRALEGKKLPVYGRGENIRDWIYVEDYCRAILVALDQGRIGESYCIGGGNECRNIDLVHKICALLDDIKPRADTGSYAQQIDFVSDRPGHDFRYAINSAKAQRELGWKPEMPFENGLRQTVEWYVSHSN